MLINREINLILTWSACFVIYFATWTKKTAITNTKLYVPVATLSTNENAELLQQLKTSFKGTIAWIRYQSKATIEKQNQYLGYLNDATIIFIVF